MQPGSATTANRVILHLDLVRRPLHPPPARAPCVLPERDGGGRSNGERRLVCEPLRRARAVCVQDAFYAQVEQVRLGVDPAHPLCVQQWNGVIAGAYQPLHHSPRTRLAETPVVAPYLLLPRHTCRRCLRYRR